MSYAFITSGALGATSGNVNVEYDDLAAQAMHAVATTVDIDELGPGGQFVSYVMNSAVGAIAGSGFNLGDFLTNAGVQLGVAVAKDVVKDVLDIVPVVGAVVNVVIDIVVGLTGAPTVSVSVLRSQYCRERWYCEPEPSGTVVYPADMFTDRNGIRCNLPYYMSGDSRLTMCVRHEGMPTQQELATKSGLEKLKAYQASFQAIRDHDIGSTKPWYSAYSSGVAIPGDYTVSGYSWDPCKPDKMMGAGTGGTNRLAYYNNPNSDWRREWDYRIPSIGRALIAVTEFKGNLDWARSHRGEILAVMGLSGNRAAVSAASEAAHARVQNPGEPPTYDDVPVGAGPIGIPESRRAVFKKLRLAIQASAKTGSDFGQALWPVYMDLLYNEFVKGHLNRAYVWYLLNARHPCHRYDDRPMMALLGLVSRYHIDRYPIVSTEISAKAEADAQLKKAKAKADLLIFAEKADLRKLGAWWTKKQQVKEDARGPVVVRGPTPTDSRSSPLAMAAVGMLGAAGVIWYLKKRKDQRRRT